MSYVCAIEYMDGRKEPLRNLDIISYVCREGRISISGVSPSKVNLAEMVGEGHAILVSKGDLSSEIGRVIPIKGNVRHVSFEEDEQPRD